MKKKKPSNGLTPWKARQRAIQSADSLLAKADALLAAEARNPKQAALFYEAAARAYLRGTLGLMSRKPWASAKECYQRLGDELNVAKCDRLRAAIPAYWEDDDQSPPETASMSD